MLLVLSLHWLHKSFGGGGIGLKGALKLCLLVFFFITAVSQVKSLVSEPTWKVFSQLPRTFTQIEIRKPGEGEYPGTSMLPVSFGNILKLKRLAFSVITGPGQILFAPPIWDEKYFNTIIIPPGTLIHYFLWPAVFYGAWFVWKRRRRQGFVLISYLIVIFTAAILLGEHGVSMRHRFQFMPLIVILASVGLQYFRRLRQVYWLYGFLLTLGTLVLWIIKRGLPLWYLVVMVLVIVTSLILASRSDFFGVARDYMVKSRNRD
jgi:hypothetical protein